MVERLIGFGGGAHAAGGEQNVELREQPANFLLHDRADAHGLQIILGGDFEARFQARDMFGVGELIDFAARNKGLEN